MSREPVGGYILFPSTLGQGDLITSTLQAMELTPEEFEVRLPDEDGFPHLPLEGYPLRTVESPDLALELLTQVECGVIEGKASKGAETFWFEPVAASYPVMNIWVGNSSMDYHKWPRKVESVARRWLQLCIQDQAVFGYFSPFAFMFERDYLEEHILPALQGGSVRDLLEQIMPSWLIYLGSDLAERWREEQMPAPSPLLTSQDLPSGAHFFRASLDISESSLSRFHS